MERLAVAVADNGRAKTSARLCATRDRWRARVGFEPRPAPLPKTTKLTDPAFAGSVSPYPPVVTPTRQHSHYALSRSLFALDKQSPALVGNQLMPNSLTLP